MTCSCGHSEASHVLGGACRVPECNCDRFRPFTEVTGGRSQAWDRGPWPSATDMDNEGDDMASKASKKKTGGKARVRHGASLMQTDRPRRIEIHLAPPRYTERQHARPGAGIKRSRAAMAQRPR